MNTIFGMIVMLAISRITHLCVRLLRTDVSLVETLVIRKLIKVRCLSKILFIPVSEFSANANGLLQAALAEERSDISVFTLQGEYVRREKIALTITAFPYQLMMQIATRWLIASADSVTHRTGAT